MAETVITGLNESDRNKIQGLLDESAERLENVPYRDRPGWEPGDTTEVYIAKAPTAQEEPPGGIPALTVQPGGFDRPGYAKCRIYRISPGTTGIPELHPLEDKKLRVYNLTRSAVPASEWITVQRSKSGAWLAQVAGVGSAAPPRQPPDIALVTQARVGAYHVAYLLRDFEPNANPPRFIYDPRRDRVLVLNLADAVAEEGGI